MTIKTYNMKKDGLPTGLTRLTSGNITVQVHTYLKSKRKFGAFGCSTYPTEEQALTARNKVLELIGKTEDTRRRISEWQIREVLNEYRKTIGLRPIKQKV